MTPFVSGGYLADNPFEPAFAADLLDVAVFGTTIVALTEAPTFGTSLYLVHEIDLDTGAQVQQLNGIGQANELELAGDTAYVVALGLSDWEVTRFDLATGSKDGTGLGQIRLNSLDFAYIPEPASGLLVVFGLGILGTRAWRR